MRQSNSELQKLRGLAHRYGIPLDLVDRLTLRPREVAQATGFSYSKVAEWIASGRLPSIKIDGAVGIPLCDLLDFLETHRRARTPDPSTLNPTEKALQLLGEEELIDLK